MSQNPFGLTVEYARRYRYNAEQWVRDTYQLVDTFDADGKQLTGIWPDQQELLQAYSHGTRRISKVSGHRVGKTTSLAWIVIHHAIFFFPQKTNVTAPTEKQLFNALANEIKAWMGKLPKELFDLFEITKERITFRPSPNESFISFAVSRAEVPEALAGAHSQHPLLVGDEASGIPDPVFDAADSVMASPNAQMILCGNPLRTSGLFFDSHNKQRAMWWRQHVSSIGHPNVTPEWVEEKRVQYGAESNRFRVRVLGEFPLGEEDKVIAFADLEAALVRDVVAQPVQPIWGLDIGRSLRRDSSALAKRQGNALMEIVRTWHYTDPMQSVALVKAEWDATPPSRRPTAIPFDVIGEGSGVGYRLMELGLPMLPINVAEVDPLVHPEKYANLRAELYYEARDWFTRKDSRINGTNKDGTTWEDSALADELGEPTMKFRRTTGKQMVESKDDMKARGVPSPNRADAFVLTFAVPAVSSRPDTEHQTQYSRTKALPSRDASYA